MMQDGDRSQQDKQSYRYSSNGRILFKKDGAYAWTNVGGSALTNGADDLLNSYIITRTSLVVRFGNTDGTTSNIYYEGTAWLTAFSVSAPTEDTATYSLSLTGTGALTQTIS